MEPVQVERFYLGCLAHASYMVGADGVAAVIDPQRDVDIYLDTAAAKGWKIEHIIETHVHADFVSGHRELAERTGARIYLGAGSGAEFPHMAVEDGDEIDFGPCCLQFLQTPGHTAESICILMKDRGEPGRPATVFTGDTLFVGDVGRPDLSPTYTPEQLAAILYQSIHEKLLTLPDETEIYPAHGAGSLCGRNMSSEASSTIGEQRRSNYALLARNTEEFVHLLTDNLPAAPEYFAQEAELNRRGAAHVSQLSAMAALTAPEVLRLQSEGAVVVDTRPATQFAAAHVPGSVHIALTGQYASWAARILGLNTQLIIVGEDPEHVHESQLRLARVGLESVVGYLQDGVAGWVDAGYELASIPQVTAQDFAELRKQEPERLTVLDVRELGEISGGAIDNAVCIPLGKLRSRMAELDQEKLLVVHCKGGYRSSIATSLLQRAGFRDVANLIGGFDAWKATGLPYVVPV
ncbi:MAG TPA: rhodanese-like domain-containing protein [Bryobacteraceae bacterium]|jgi:glyoxylase-like metal-dependent hydrolase (beta-lactamase superfamily II)/rhodanese-related sulfurtransferase|nr:rhodanese-like domain-containing protein [Bryobacteraceae bacterium]